MPAILEKTFEGVAEKCERLAGVSGRAQLDVADGVFVPEQTWNDPSRLSELPQGLAFDVHLMVEKPEQLIVKWDQPNVFRITFHLSATYDVLRTIKLIKETGTQVGLALNVEQSVAAAYDVLSDVDLILIMGTNPGAQGREFDPRVIDKVRELRQYSAEIAIGVDGGVSPLVAPSLLEAGATVLVSGSYLFGEEDIKAAIASLGG